MSAHASLTIPIAAGGPAEAREVEQILAATAGIGDIAVDAAAGKASFTFQFPGNLDAVMRRLRHRRLAPAQTAAIEIPVKCLSGRIVDPTSLIVALNASPLVQGAGYDGDIVSATIWPGTNVTRYLFEEIIIAGLMPIDIPTTAGKQEFVL